MRGHVQKRGQTWTCVVYGGRDPADVRTFLAAVEGERDAAAYRVLIATGMRRGEVLGRRWPLRRLESKPAHDQTFAHRCRQRRGLVATEDGTLPAIALARSGDGRRPASASGRSVGGAGRSRDVWNGEIHLVFCDEIGDALHPNRFTRRFQSAARRAGVPVIRLRDLRHTWATLALQAGVHPKIVSERLGHATTGITLDVYSHV